MGLRIVLLGPIYIRACRIKVPKLTLYLSDQVSDLARASQQGISQFFQVGVLLEVGGSPPLKRFPKNYLEMGNIDTPLIECISISYVIINPIMIWHVIKSNPWKSWAGPKASLAPSPRRFFWEESESSDSLGSGDAGRWFSILLPDGLKLARPLALAQQGWHTGGTLGMEHQ